MNATPSTTVDQLQDRLAFDFTDRLVKSLKVSDMGVSEMAERLGVSRATIANWTSGRIKPGKQARLLWAIYTQVPYEWLETGKFPPSGEGPDEGNPLSFLRESNSRPFHYNDYNSSLARAMHTRDVGQTLCELAECYAWAGCGVAAAA